MSETAAQRTARMLALLPWLTQHDDVSVEDAAAEFGVSTRQLLDDLATLTFTGPDQGGGGLVDIDYEDGTISVLDTQGIDRPLRLTTAEAAALMVGLQVLDQVPGAHDHAAIARAQDALRVAAGQAAAAVAVHVRGRGDSAISQANSQAITDALAHGRALEIEYEGAARDTVTVRIIDPVRVLVAEGYSYVEAYCRRARATRLFRLDRIARARVLDEPSQPQQPEPAGEFFESTTETFLLDLPAQSRWVIERYPTTSVQERPDGSVVAELPLADPSWAVRLGLRLAGRGTVLGPPEVQAEVRRKAKAALDLYES